MGMVALLLLLAAYPRESEAGFFPVTFGYAEASADLRNDLRTLSLDSLLLIPRLSLLGEGYRMRAVFQASPLVADSVFRVRHASVGLRWPGSPWIGAMGAYGADAPFLFSLERPWLEWDNRGRDSLTAVTLEGGGILGFSAFYSQYRSGMTDSLTWIGVRSPWLGFGQFWWDGFRRHHPLPDGLPEATMNTFTGFLLFPAFSPWFSVSQESGVRRMDAEIRGLGPKLNGPFSLMTVPWAHVSSEDSTMVGIKALFTGIGTAQSGFLRIGIPVESRGSPEVAARYTMRSVAGIHWETGVSWSRNGGWSSGSRSVYRGVPGGFGMTLDTYADSVRIGALAMYTPLPGVAAEAALSGAFFSEVLDPEGSLRVSAFRGPVEAGITLFWREGVTGLSLGMKGWMAP